MVLTERKRWVYLCVLIAVRGLALGQQDAPKPAPAAQSPAQPPAGAAPQEPVPGISPRPASIPSAPAATPSPAAVAGEQRDSGDGVTSVTLSYWLNSANPPKMRTGKTAPSGYPANLDFAGKTRDVPGVTVSFPAGNQNTLRFSYFRGRGQGNTTAPGPTVIYGAGYNNGDYLSTGYMVQNAKASLDYFSWPFPAPGHHFRLKTLWEVQLVSVRWAVDAPYNPTEDADGNVLATSAAKTNWFFIPSLGLGVEYLLSKHFRWEAKASGFAFRGHQAVADAETFGAYRAGQIEFQFGGKGFYFETSSAQEQYVKGMLYGAFVGVRWYPK